MAAAAYRFGAFRLEPAERRLSGSAGVVSLPPKAFDLLVILVSNAGRLLRKEALMEQLWPGVFVEEVNLAQAVSVIRRALGGHRRAFVETIAGSGYRFVAPVQVVVPPSMPAAGDRPPRLIVLPFQFLTPPGDIAFLSFSLAEAVSASLAGLETVVVRSTLTAAKYSTDVPDLLRIARDADVTLVVSGTIARIGNELRVAVQLADAAAGALLWSHTETGTVVQLFSMQDALVERIVGSLALPLAPREQQRLRRDVPRSARAYEYYLRGNQASLEGDAWPIARDLYLQAIDDDPDYAPSWARLARVYRLIGKYRPEARDSSFARSKEALERALSLNPDLSMAHTLYALIDADRGHAQSAMVRLLGRAAVHPADAETYRALVHACRYCGLLDASLAADRRARYLDESIASSVMHTLFVMQRYDEVLSAQGLIKGYVYVMSLFASGRRTEALDAAVTLAREGSRVATLVEAARALFEDRRNDSLWVLDRYVKTIADPEGLYYVARHCAYLDSPERALPLIARAIRRRVPLLFRARE